MRRPAVALALLAALATSACSPSTGANSNQPVTESGNTARSPGKVVDVVVSVSQWTDLPRTLGGDCVSVTTVLASSAIDPHDFEPKPGDIAAFEKAGVSVVDVTESPRDPDGSFVAWQLGQLRQLSAALGTR